VSSAFTKSVVEEAALAWLDSAGWQVRNGAEIAPGEPAAERDAYGQVVLTQRLRDALLQQVISGKLRVQEAERAIKETNV
jgi:type I restriction enzyme R subunit